MIVLAALAALAADPTPELPIEGPVEAPEVEAYVSASSGMHVVLRDTPRPASRLAYEVGLESRDGIDLRVRGEAFLGQQQVRQTFICQPMAGMPCEEAAVRPLATLAAPIGGALRIRPHARIWLSGGPVLAVAEHEVSISGRDPVVEQRTTTHFGGLAELGYRVRSTDHVGLHVSLDVQSLRTPTRRFVENDSGDMAAFRGWTVVGVRMGGLWFPGKRATRG